LEVWAVDLICGGGDVSLLSTRERARASRLKRPDERRSSLEAHCAVRRILAVQLGVDPGHLEFDATDVGKPFLTKPAQALQFNLSHSGRHGLIAVAEDRSVGVDIEMFRPMSDLLGVAMGIATAQEIDLLRQLPAGEMRSSFFDLWARKEALLKAIGRVLLIDQAGGGWNWKGPQLYHFRRTGLDRRNPCDQREREGSRGNRGRIYDSARGEALPMSAIGYKRSQAVQAAKDPSL
jgi:hypothetical protein